MLCLRSGYVLAEQPLSEGEERLFWFETPVVVKMSRYLIKNGSFSSPQTRGLYIQIASCVKQSEHSLYPAVTCLVSPLVPDTTHTHI